MNKWYFQTEVKPSKIHGFGRYTLEPIQKGKLVLTIYGNIYKNKNNSFVNHSLTNNLNWNGNNSWVAAKNISPGEELTMNYNQWIDISHLGWDT